MESQIAVEQKRGKHVRSEYWKEYYVQNQKKKKDYGVSYYWKNRARILAEKKAKYETKSN